MTDSPSCVLFLCVFLSLLYFALHTSCACVCEVQVRARIEIEMLRYAHLLDAHGGELLLDHT
jgi:hypothetical protein